MTVFNVKVAACSDELRQNYRQTLQFPLSSYGAL